MDDGVVQETEMFRSFLIPEARDRFLALRGTKKGRPKLRGALAHLRKLDPRFVTPVPGSAHDPQELARLLQARGASESCWVVSEDPALDARRMPLKDALEAVVGRGMGTLVSCVLGRLAYYEGEEAGTRCILERPHASGEAGRSA